MKTLATITAVLASASLTLAGLMPKSPTPNPNLPSVIGCYPTANAPANPPPLSWKIGYCDGLLNGDNCLLFCTCNDKSVIVCDSKYMDGCNNEQMAAGCSANGANGKSNGHWYCICNLAPA